jgi:DNA-binding CsgD family transcriptional regulator
MKLAPQVHYQRRGMSAVACPDSPTILMIDRDRRLLDCTSSAAGMLDRRDLLACEFGRVAACRQHHRARLNAAIEKAAESGSATLTLEEDALRIQIVRFGSEVSEARFLLICRQRAKDMTQHVETAAHLFGLTRAEHRLLKLLFDGMSLASAATSLGVARTTARTHLQRIFDKTGSRRQSDLVRLVALAQTTILHSSTP